MDNRKWFMKVENPKTKIELTIFCDGSVYTSENSQKVLILNNKGMEKIQEIVKPNMYMLRTLRYFKQRKEGFVIRINDTSRKHKNIIKIVGWTYETQILNILKNNEYIKEIF